jgi:FAD:protein FMN transferase
VFLKVCPVASCCRKAGSIRCECAQDRHQLSRDPGTRSSTTASPYPLGRAGRHRCDRIDRRGGGQGAPRLEWSGDYQGCRCDPDALHTGARRVVSLVIDASWRVAHAIFRFPLSDNVRPSYNHLSVDGSIDWRRFCADHHVTDIGTHDNDHFATTDNDHDPSCRYLRRVVEMTVTLAPVARSFRAIGTTATVVVLDPSRADEAEVLLRREIEAIDLACSRFRPDSEIEHLHSLAGASVKVSSLLFEAIDVAVSVAERTRGAVDPTVGNAIAMLGYDRDFDLIAGRPPSQPKGLGPVVGFGHIHLNKRTHSVRIPRGVRLDLGSSAKALVADRSANSIANRLDTGVLVSVGGDVAVAGPAPDGGWPVGIASDSCAQGSAIDQVVAVRQGGLASSSTTVRTWSAGGEVVHHIIDPSTGRSALPYWILVSVTGSSCVDANALSTAAIVWGQDALDRLRPFEQAVRLVRHDGEVVTVGGWPQGEPS